MPKKIQMQKTYKSYIYFNPVTRVFWFRDESLWSSLFASDLRCVSTDIRYSYIKGFVLVAQPQNILWKRCNLHLSQPENLRQVWGYTGITNDYNTWYHKLHKLEHNCITAQSDLRVEYILIVMSDNNKHCSSIWWTDSNPARSPSTITSQTYAFLP